MEARAQLGALSRIDGIRVPAGFCVPTDAFRRVIAEAPSIDDRLDQLSRLDPGDRDAIRTLSAEIRRAIDGIAIPGDLAAAITCAPHMSLPWRIHEIIGDFRLEDVWALPMPGGRDDFPRLVRWLASRDHPVRSSGSAVVRALWAARLKAGQVLGWVSPAAGVGSRAPTLRDRLPDDLRSAPTGPAFRVRTRTPLYLLDDEFAAEIANRTMHGVLHVGWVPDRTRATSSGPGADSTPGTAAPAGLRSGGRLADSLSGSRGPPHVARLVVPVVVDPADGE